jgi:hypothetical protein
MKINKENINKVYEMIREDDVLIMVISIKDDRIHILNSEFYKKHKKKIDNAIIKTLEA